MNIAQISVEATEMFWPTEQQDFIVKGFIYCHNEMFVQRKVKAKVLIFNDQCNFCKSFKMCKVAAISLLNIFLKTYQYVLD